MPTTITIIFSLVTLKIPTIPFPRVLMEETSVIIAILNETLPLLIPPINRARINKTKLLDNAQSMYDIAIPV